MKRLGLVSGCVMAMVILGACGSVPADQASSGAKPAAAAASHTPVVNNAIVVSKKILDWYNGGVSDDMNTMQTDVETLVSDAKAGDTGSAQSDCGSWLNDIDSMEADLPAPDSQLDSSFSSLVTDERAAANACVAGSFDEAATYAGQASGDLNDITARIKDLTSQLGG